MFVAEGIGRVNGNERMTVSDASEWRETPIVGSPPSNHGDETGPDQSDTVLGQDQEVSRCQISHCALPERMFTLPAQGIDIRSIVSLACGSPKL